MVSYSFSYDEKGHETESKEMVANGDVSMTQKFGYNNEGQITENAVYDKDNQLIVKYVYRYENGNQIEHSEYKNDGRAAYREFSIFDEFGNWTEREIWSSGVSVTETKKREYKYDSLGNWTYLIQSNGLSVQTIFERNIEYFQ